MPKPFSLTNWKELKSDEQGKLIESLLERIEVLEQQVLELTGEPGDTGDTGGAG